MPDLTPKKAAKALFEAMNTRDLQNFTELLAEEIIFHFPGTAPLEGPDRIIRFLKVLFYKFPRLDFKISRIVANETGAAVEWTNEGNFRKGAPYTNAGVTWLELVDGKIVYLSDTFKDTAMFTR